MTRKTSIISQLGNYFAAKGGVMTAEEYKDAEDAPIRFVLVKRAIGSWSRVLNMIGSLDQYDGTIPSPLVYKLDEELEETEESTPEKEEPQVKPQEAKPTGKKGTAKE